MIARLAVIAVFVFCGCVKKSTYQKALDENARLRQENAAQKTTLMGQIEALNGQMAALSQNADAELKNKDAKVKTLEGQKSATEKELAELRRQKEAAEKRIAAFKAMQEKFRALVDTGKLQVAFRNGQMTLKLPSGILFPSGSAELSKAGQAALGDVVKILLEFKDRRFVVAGHTDNQPIKTRVFKNNWYLSTARANSVVQFMIQQQFPAKSLAAAGYGEFDPVAPNDSDQGREQNRRIELILVPNLEELPNLAGAGG
jgi:chemotaxis protein MotB